MLTEFINESSLAVILVTYTIFSIVVLVVSTIVIQRFLRKVMKHPRSFHMTVLRIMIPKEGQEEQPNQNLSTDQIRERISVAEVFFSTLGGMKAQKGWKAFWFGRSDHFALEMVADHEGLITFYAAVPRTMKPYFEQQIQAQYEMAEVHEVEDYNIFTPQGVVIGATLSLEKHYIFSINSYDKMESDPLNSLTNVLSKFEKTEGAAIQYVLRSARPEWHNFPAEVAHEMQQGKKVEDALKEVKANPLVKAWRIVAPMFFPSKREEKVYRLSPAEDQVVKSLEEKTSKAGFDVNVRIVVAAADRQTAEFKLSNILNAFSQYGGYQFGNQFTASKVQTHEKLIHDFIYRTFDEKKSFVLNTKEMASLWHLPLPTTETPNIRWLMSRKAPPPANMPKEGVILGKVVYRGEETMVRIKRADRRRHMYVIGKSGSGKSELMRYMAIQDIQNGEGVAVIDPHGDLIEGILPHIPKERADDVVIFDPSDIERPMGLNMLEYDNDEQRDFAVQEMVAIFYKLFGQEMIGPMFEHYMRNAMLAMMEDKESGATLIEIPRMFTDADFRKKKVAKVKNMIVKSFWEQEYEQSQAGQQAADMLSYVISKIGRFLTNDMMRNIIGQSRSAFNVREVMDNQKILLVNLSKGKIGEVNSSLLGLIMVSKIQMAAMARASMAKEKRKDFYLYMDEFQNFTTDSIAIILSEARKYLLNMTMAHQYIGQLVVNNDTKIRDAVFGNAGTMAAFRVGADDAEFLEKEFAPVFNQGDIINVDQYTSNIKLLIDNTASRPFNMKTIMAPDGNLDMIPLLKELARMKFGRPRLEVEAEIKERAQWDNLKGGGMTGPDAFI